MKKIFLGIILVAVMTIYGGVEKVRTTATELEFKVQFNVELSLEGEFTHLNYIENDWTETDESGAPNLPYRVLRIAVPPEGDIRISYDIQDSEHKILMKPLLPAATIIPDEETSQFIYVINQAKYKRSQKMVVTNGAAYNYNSYRLIPVYIYPVIYDYEHSVLEEIQEMRIRIEILGNTRWQGETLSNPSVWDRDFITNYNQARNWRQVQSRELKGINWSATQFWYKVVINGSGVYRFGETIWNILPEWAQSSNLRLFSLEKRGEDFEAAEVSLFTGGSEVQFSYQGGNSVLWLAAGGSFPEQPIRTDKPETNIETIEAIENYIPINPGRGREIECLLIRPAAYFESAAEELSEIHLDYFNIETAIAIQEDIFAIESGGIAEASAIRAFLEDYKENNASLEYVVLMGSGTTDFSNPAGKNKIITWTANEVTYDDYFVDFNSDIRPDLIIGRIPAQSESMMSSYLQRIRDYYDNMETDWWQNRVLMIADDENKTGGLEGAGISSPMNHTLKMEETEEVLPGRILEKVYGLEYPFDSYQNKPGAAVDILEALNRGCLVTYYIGHGSWDKLGDEDYFTNEMIPQIDNYEHLTQFLAGSCNVGRFSKVSENCLAELLLFGEDGGSIVSIAASYDSSPLSNAQLLSAYLDRIYNHNESIGTALVYAKYNSGASTSNSKKYNILGDPVLKLPVPQLTGSITGLTDSLQYRQTVSYQGDFENSSLNVEGETVVYDSEQLIHYSNFIPPDTTQVYEVNYYRNGGVIFRGGVSLTAGEYQSSFIVPDNAGTGARGTILTWAEGDSSAYLNSKQGIRFVDSALPIVNESAPEVLLYLDSRNFRSGDTVSEEPLLIADIADSSGINLTVNSGKNIMILLDDSENPEDLIDVSEGFIYNEGSYTRGTLTSNLPVLPKGAHNLKLIVYDNFGLATVTATDFRIIEQGSMAITDILPYPHPMSDEGYFTFVLTAEAEVTINIYTISGRKIKSLKNFCNTGYNQIFWDCRDADGDRIANNNYLYRIKAKNTETGRTARETGKLVILK
ncbi:MAG: hypothetical protein K9N06_05210 [Candidatus Cloacimonetes bacterium]|nr:hypothetical protein [Candidatus Cloacimonadota bacterium]